MANKIQLRRDTTANWERVNPILADGEPGLDITENKVKYGDGANAWVDLSYASGGGGADTGNISFDNINIMGDGHIHLQPNADVSEAYLDIYLTTGPDIHIAGNGENLIIGRDSGANVSVKADGNVSIQSDNGTLHSWTFGSDGNLTLPDTSTVVGALTSSFTGTIAGTTLTVTGATAGTIALNQSIEGPGLVADTFIVTQLTGTSGGNGTYTVSQSQTIGPITMNVAAMFLNAGLKLGVNHAVYQRDEHDETLYNYLIGIEKVEATIHIGDENTNGVCITNDKEYKVHSALNPGTFMAVAKVDTGDNVILSSGNAANTEIKVGGLGSGYALKFKNGGQALIPVGLRIGDNTNSSIFNAPLEVGSVLAGNPNNQSNPGGIALPTYRGTGTLISNDEWGSYIYGARYRGTINSPLPVKNGDWLMEWGATAFDGTNNGGGGEMAFRVDGTVSSTSNPSKWELYVCPPNVSTTTGQTLGLKVDSSLTVTTYGNLVVGGEIKTTAGTGAVAVQSNDGSNTFNWNFNTHGSIALPALLSGAQGYGSLDANNNKIALTSGDTVNFSNFSGMILVNTHNGGGVSLYLCGGGTGDAVAIGDSKAGNSVGTMAFNNGISGYTFTADETGDHVFCAIRTRTGG